MNSKLVKKLEPNTTAEISRWLKQQETVAAWINDITDKLMNAIVYQLCGMTKC